jgi:hypothetical protein
MLVPLAEWARRELEEQADEILDKDRRNYPTIPGIYYFDILSHDQLERRVEREMLTKSGNFQVYLKPGCYQRTWNPLANTRPSRQRQYSLIADPWRQFSWESVGHSGGALQAWFPDARREEVTSGCHMDTWFTRDPMGVTPAGQNYYYHLDRQQRCRIRAIMKAIPVTKPLAREAVKMHLARHYGIPWWVVIRCVVNNHSNDI